MDVRVNLAPEPLQPDELPRLLRRLRTVMSQVWLAGKDFGDLDSLPPQHVAAALVVQEAATELNDLYERWQQWLMRQEILTPRFSVVLKNYAPERKIHLIRAIRETAPGFSLTQAKAIVESNLPARIVGSVAREQAQVMMRAFEAAGAVCELDRI
jgi:ribosomal protein L7/L12